MPRCLIALFALLWAVSAWATPRFVDLTSGSNSNNGLSAGAPLLTIWAADGVAQPGDLICVKGATSAHMGLVAGHWGTPTAPITYQGNCPGFGTGRAYVPQDDTTHNAFYIGAHGHSVIIRGFEFTAPNTNGANCISTGFGVYDIAIIDNVIHGCGANGILLFEGDHWYVAHNVIYNNSNNTTSANTSGISLLGETCIDLGTGLPTTTKCNAAYVVVEGNVLYNNQNVCCHSGSTTDSDGNGIIVDDADNYWGPSGACAGYTSCPFTYSAGTWWGSPDVGSASPYANTPYPGTTLLLNNTFVGSGSAGIHAFLSPNVWSIGNTGWHDTMDTNSGCPHCGSIDYTSVSGGGIFNNVAETCGTACNASGWHAAISIKGSTLGTLSVPSSNISTGCNLVYDTSGATTTLSGVNVQSLISIDLSSGATNSITTPTTGGTANSVASPVFQAASQSLTADLRPATGSPALASGCLVSSTAFKAQMNDILSRARSATTPSRGAFEFPL